MKYMSRTKSWTCSYKFVLILFLTIIVSVSFNLMLSSAQAQNTFVRVVDVIAGDDAVESIIFQDENGGALVNSQLGVRVADPTVVTVSILNPQGNDTAIDGTGALTAFTDGNGMETFKITGLKAGATTITIVEVSGRFEIDHEVITVNVVNFKADFSVSNSVVRSAPLSLDFTDTSQGTVKTRVWDFGDGTAPVLNQSAVSHTFNNDGSFNVSLDITGTNTVDVDISSRQVKTILVDAAAVQNPAIGVISVISDDMDIVVGKETIETVTVFNSMDFDAKANAQTLGNATIRVTVDDPTIASVSVLNPGINDANFDPVTGELSALSGGNGQETFRINGLREGSTFISFVIDGALDITPALITLNVINLEPVISLVKLSDGNEAPMQVRFNDNSTGSIISRKWDFCDGTPPVTLTPADGTTTVEHVFKTEGSYNVTLEVTGPNSAGVGISNETVTTINVGVGGTKVSGSTVEDVINLLVNEPELKTFTLKDENSNLLGVDEVVTITVERPDVIELSSLDDDQVSGLSGKLNLTTDGNSEIKFMLEGLKPGTGGIIMEFGTGGRAELGVNVINVDARIGKSPDVEFGLSPFSMVFSDTSSISNNDVIISRRWDFGDGVTRVWNEGDGTTNDVSTVVHLFNAVGLFTVTLDIVAGTSIGNIKDSTGTPIVVLPGDSLVFGTILGSIRNADTSEPMSGVLIRIQSSSIDRSIAGTRRFTVSRNDGSFVFKNLLPGLYAVTAFSAGLQTDVVTTVLEGGGSLFVEVTFEGLPVPVPEEKKGGGGGGNGGGGNGGGDDNSPKDLFPAIGSF